MVLNAWHHESAYLTTLFHGATVPTGTVAPWHHAGTI